jgi:similar to stage IV sporulation protein
VLKECGVAIGARKNALDIDVIENRVLIFSDDISWISINILGNVAEVEIREREIIEDTEYMTAANLVAEREGIIEYFEDTRGKVAVDIGEAVSEGELLVGGIYGTEEEGFRYTVARGRVLARTEREFLVEIPLEYEKKVYTGRAFTEKYLIFFKKEVKFYGNSGNLCASCDTIDTVEYFSALEGTELPFGIRTVRHLEYEYRTEQRSVEEATELAYYTLRCKIEREIPDAELLSKKISFDIGESFYRLECKMSVIEDIATVKEISVTLP